jgi:hypothetical protein
MRGVIIVSMTETEIKLIELINENDNTNQAILTAVEAILSFLEQRESSLKPSADPFPEPA